MNKALIIAAALLLAGGLFTAGFVASGLHGRSEKTWLSQPPDGYYHSSEFEIPPPGASLYSKDDLIKAGYALFVPGTTNMSPVIVNYSDQSVRSLSLQVQETNIIADTAQVTQGEIVPETYQANESLQPRQSVDAIRRQREREKFEALNEQIVYQNDAETTSDTVVIVNGSRYFHRLDCSLIQGIPYTLLFREKAIEAGYIRCSACL